jgi:hypothetical protein
MSDELDATIGDSAQGPAEPWRKAGELRDHRPEDQVAAGAGGERVALSASCPHGAALAARLTMFRGSE